MEEAAVVEAQWFDEERTDRYGLEEREMDLLRRVARTAEGQAFLRTLLEGS